MGNASQCEKSRSAEGRYQGVPVSLGSCQMTSSEENKHVTAKKKKKKANIRDCTYMPEGTPIMSVCRTP